MAASLEERFKNAVKLVQSLPPNGPFQPSNGMKLKFYALFKQASVGKCTGRRPGFYDIVGRAKWDAWNYLGDLSAEEAKEGYIEELKKIIEVWPQSEEATTFLESMGPVFEIVEDTDDDDAKSEPVIIDDVSTAEDSAYISTPNQPEDEEAAQSEERPHPSDSEDEFCDSTENFENYNGSSRTTLSERVGVSRLHSELREAPRTVEPARPVGSSSESTAVSQQIVQTLAQMHSELNRIEQRLNKLERHLQNLSLRGRWLLWLMGSFPVIAALLFVLLVRAKRKRK